MKRLMRKGPSPALVIACLALAVALGGTGYAAVSLPRNSVGTVQLKNDAVVSSKVRNGSLLKTDFRAGQIPTGPQGPQGPGGATGATGATGAAGAAGVAAPGYVAQVISANNSGSSSSNNNAYDDVNNASVNVTVPTGETDQFIVYFSAQSACYGGTSLHACRVRLVLDGNDMSPGAQVFDVNTLKNTVQVTAQTGTVCSNSNTCTGTFIKTSDASTAGAMIRVSGNVTAGTHVVKAQFSTSAGETTLQLSAYTLIVERIKLA